MPHFSSRPYHPSLPHRCGSDCVCSDVSWSSRCRTSIRCTADGSDCTIYCPPARRTCCSRCVACISSELLLDRTLPRLLETVVDPPLQLAERHCIQPDRSCFLICQRRCLLRGRQRALSKQSKKAIILFRQPRQEPLLYGGGSRFKNQQC